MGFPALAPVPAGDKRAALRAGLASGRLLRMPGAFSPLVARLVEELGFDGAYVSGAVVAADLGLPDVGLTTLTEVGRRARQIASATSLPVLADADTGFGEPLNAARTVAELDDLGLAGCHLEDQVNPKRCGHLDGKEVVPTLDMVRRLQAAVAARRDPGFLVVARSDARAVEGLGGLLERARAYVDAGAEMLFPEALADLGHGGEPDVGQPQVGGHHRPGHVGPVEAELLDQPGHQRRERPGHAQQPPRGQPGPQGRPLVGRRDPGHGREGHQKIRYLR